MNFVKMVRECYEYFWSFSTNHQIFKELQNTKLRQIYFKFSANTLYNDQKYTDQFMRSNNKHLMNVKETAADKICPAKGI